MRVKIFESKVAREFFVQKQIYYMLEMSCEL